MSNVLGFNVGVWIALGAIFVVYMIIYLHDRKR